MKAHNSLAGLPWSAQDWSQPDTTIAQQLGCDSKTVGHYRQIHAPRPLQTPIPWHTVADWGGKSNATIAGDLGVPLKTVSAYRRKNKLPHGPRSHGTGVYQRTVRTVKPLTLRARAARLNAVWAWLWPDDPMNLRRLDEVAAIKQRTHCSQLP